MSYCLNYKFTRNKRLIMLKSMQTVFFYGTLFLYSLIGLQSGMMMQLRNQALKVATNPLNKLISSV